MKKTTVLFSGEKLLIIVSMIGFFLAAVCAFYVIQNGAIVLPEGNVASAFSFNAAIAVFLLSIAAIMPLSGLNSRKRTIVRWGFILSAMISYGIETIQHFRGINPRFSKVGSFVDIIFGGVFGLASIIIALVSLVLAAAFISKNQTNVRPLLHLSIRYSFVSIMIAFAAGLVMVVLQSRYFGAEGNFIVVHGLGFHALQALLLHGWVLERSGFDENKALRLIHIGSIAWIIFIAAIGIQTILGKTVFELTTLPIVASIALFIWCITFIYGSLLYLKMFTCKRNHLFHNHSKGGN